MLHSQFTLKIVTHNRVDTETVASEMLADITQVLKQELMFTIIVKTRIIRFVDSNNGRVLLKCVSCCDEAQTVSTLFPVLFPTG